MVSGEEVARLIIYGITPDDAGDYSISVSNTFGQASDIVNVNVVGKRHSLSLSRATTHFFSPYWSLPQ